MNLLVSGIFSSLSAIFHAENVWFSAYKQLGAKQKYARFENHSTLAEWHNICKLSRALYMKDHAVASETHKQTKIQYI